MSCRCLDVQIQMITGEDSVLHTSGCVRFEIEVLGNTPMMFDRSTPIYPADGKVCFPSIEGLPYCRDYGVDWNADGISSPEKKARVTRYFIKEASA